jgi:hypothetical protein
LYYWELVHQPQVSPALRSQAEAQRAANGDGLPSGWPQPLPTERGVLAINNGEFVSPVFENDGAADKASPRPKDFVINDDLIVEFSACIGVDCVNGESFGFDTLRLKENNLRIHIEDTSNSSSFPATDWRLTFNDSADGGANYFSLDELTTGSVPFRVDGGAPSNALRVASNGNIGLGTGTPILDMHINNGNTPAIRLEQNSGAGFVAQTWDVAANETSFFIRDVTNGSRLPFRITPGAGNSSIHIHADGDVGLGVGNGSQMAAALHLRRAASYTESLLRVDRPDDADPLTEERALELDNAGNLFVGGTITQLSSRHSKENFIAVTGSALLERLRGLDLWTWNYLGAPAADRHLGPVAEDFHAAFGLGSSERALAPSDVAGVALAASQALAEQVADRDAEILELKARLARLEAALEQLTADPR